MTSSVGTLPSHKPILGWCTNNTRWGRLVFKAAAIGGQSMAPSPPSLLLLLKIKIACICMRVHVRTLKSEIKKFEYKFEKKYFGKIKFSKYFQGKKIIHHPKKIGLELRHTSPKRKFDTHIWKIWKLSKVEIFWGHLWHTDTRTNRRTDLVI